MQIQELEIKRSEWLSGPQTYGDNGYDSELWNTEAKDAGYGYKCCLGFMALAMGNTPDDIKAVNTPEGLDNGGRIWGDYLTSHGDNNDFIENAMNINDAAISDDLREEQLTDLFATQDIALTFVD